jgi:hypothetical protein
MSDAVPMEEGELLETLLSQLTCEQAFMMGQIMGIIGKRHRGQLDMLKARIRVLEMKEDNERQG